MTDVYRYEESSCCQGNAISDSDREVLREAPVFDRLDDDGIELALAHLMFGKQTCSAGCVLVQPGQRMRNAGVVLRGEVELAWHDVEGKRSLLSVFRRGDIFGIFPS